MSHILMSHVTYIDESCHILIQKKGCTAGAADKMSPENKSCHMYGSVVSHIWMSHVTCTDKSCHKCELVVSHIWMSHVTHRLKKKWTAGGVDRMSPENKSCHMYAQVVAHIWMSRVTCMKETCCI